MRVGRKCGIVEANRWENSEGRFFKAMRLVMEVFKVRELIGTHKKTLRSNTPDQIYYPTLPLYVDVSTGNIFRAMEPKKAYSVSCTMINFILVSDIHIAFLVAADQA